jgi:hypothetical protein
VFGSTGKRIQQALDVAYGQLTQQIDLGDGEQSGTSRKRLATPFALGYIFGFADTLIQRAGVTDEGQVMAQLLLVYARLFGVEQGSTIFASCLQRQTDSQFAAGRATGGSEVIAWIASRGGKTPFGLADYLQVERCSPAPGTAAPLGGLSADARPPPDR